MLRTVHITFTVDPWERHFGFKEGMPSGSSSCIGLRGGLIPRRTTEERILKSLWSAIHSACELSVRELDCFLVSLVCYHCL